MKLMYHADKTIRWEEIDMELEFLGRGAAFNPALGNTSACLREGGKLLLLDCGETVFAELIRRGLLDGVSEVFAAVSHLHSDHCGSLGTLAHYCEFRLKTRLHLVVPEHAAYRGQLDTLMRLFGAEPGKQYDMVPAGSDLGFSAFERLDIVPTRHAAGMHCFSFIMETAGGGVFYSADTHTEEPFVAFMRTHPDFERAYVETTNAAGAVSVHLLMDRLAEVVPPELRSRVCLMHFANAACMEAGRKLGFGCAGE